MSFEKDIELFDVISILYKEKKSVLISFIFFTSVSYILSVNFSKIEMDNNITSSIENDNNLKMKEELNIETQNRKNELLRLKNKKDFVLDKISMQKRFMSDNKIREEYKQLEN